MAADSKCSVVARTFANEQDKYKFILFKINQIHLG